MTEQEQEQKAIRKIAVNILINVVAASVTNKRRVEFASDMTNYAMTDNWLELELELMHAIECEIFVQGAHTYLHKATIDLLARVKKQL